MNIDLAMGIVDEAVREHPSVEFPMGHSQPIPMAGSLRFQFKVSRKGVPQPTLFFEFEETNAEFDSDLCKRKVQGGIQSFLSCDKDVHCDITGN